MAVNKDKLRKRQREHAGIAVLPVTHSNEIVVRVKQSLAAGKGQAFLATEWKAQQTCSPQCLLVRLRAASSSTSRQKGGRSPNNIPSRTWELAAFYPLETPNTILFSSILSRL